MRPIIDRAVTDIEPRSSRRLSPLTGLFTLLLIASLIAGTIASLIVDIRDDDGLASTGTPVGARILYTTHDPITIAGDAEFAVMAAGEGWPGDGSAGNPYAISDLDINGTGHRWSICVNDTRVHFEVIGCWLHDGTDAGLELHNVSNAVISDLICDRTGSYGIVAVASSYNSFVNNNCSHSTYGIYLLTSSYNTIRGSTCSQAISGTAMYLDSSDNNAILQNDLSSIAASKGISLVNSDRNNISENSCWWTGYGILLMSSSNNNTIQGNSLGGNTEGIRVDTSPVNLIANNLIYGDIYAISIRTTYDVHVTGNGQGKIALASSDNCVISDNDCTGGGISLGSSHWNLIDHNICSFVQGGADGVHLESSSNNTITGNDCSHNYNYEGIAVPYPDGCGIFLLYSENNTIGNNTCVSNEGAGIEGYLCIGNTITDNNCSFNQGMYGLTGDGISVGARTIANNICIGNTEHGIGADGPGITVNDNLCIENRLGGIDLGVGSGGSSLTSNDLVRNGIVFSDSSVGVVGSWSIDTSNTVNGMPVQYLKDLATGTVPLGAGQVILVNCSNVGVEDQTLNNATIGLQMFSGSHLSIVNNTCSYNNVGILVSVTSNSTFTENAIYDNLGFGIDMRGSYNTLWNNSFARNNGAGSVYSASHIQVVDYSWNNNDWNISGYGNYWSDWTSPDAIPPYGIVDQPYVISTYSPPVQDYYPLVGPVTPIPPQIPEFGLMPLVGAVLFVLIVVSGESRRRRAH